MIFLISNLVLIVSGQSLACNQDNVLVRRSVMNMNRTELGTYAAAFRSLRGHRGRLGPRIKEILDLITDTPQARDYATMGAWLRLFLAHVETILSRQDACVRTIPFWDWSDQNGYLRSQEHGVPDTLAFGRPPFTHHETAILRAQPSAGHLGYQLSGFINTCAAMHGKGLWDYYGDVRFYSVLAFHDKLLADYLAKWPFVPFSEDVASTLLRPWNVTVYEALYTHKATCRAYL